MYRSRCYRCFSPPRSPPQPRASVPVSRAAYSWGCGTRPGRRSWLSLCCRLRGWHRDRAQRGNNPRPSGKCLSLPTPDIQGRLTLYSCQSLPTPDIHSMSAVVTHTWYDHIVQSLPRVFPESLHFQITKITDIFYYILAKSPYSLYTEDIVRWIP